MSEEQQQSLTVQDQSAVAVIEAVIAKGDLAKLTPSERVGYYRQVCQSLGLNPLTRPFEYIVLNGRLTLYARRDATDQLRKLHRITVQIVSRERIEDIYLVTARASMPDGRSDESIGAVSIAGLRGDALANALMKAETKAKRRVTLSIVGLGWLDETEIETIPPAQVQVPKPDALPEPQENAPAFLESPDNERLVVQTLIKAQATKAVQERLINHWKTSAADQATVRSELATVLRNLRQWTEPEMRRFWTKMSEMSLSSEEVHELLGLPSLYLWSGTLDEALAALSARVAEQVEQAEEAQS